MDCDKLEFLPFYFPPTPPVELLKNNDKDKETDGRWARRRNKAWMVCALASPGVVLNGLGGAGAGHRSVRRRKRSSGKGSRLMRRGGGSTPCFTKHLSQVGTAALTRQRAPSRAFSEISKVWASLNGREAHLPPKLGFA